MDRPLEGIRVLSMEQAAALPFCTRHLVDLGADVIRVESHRRGGAVASEVDLFRGKRRLGLDLAAERGPEVFRLVAAQCDIVAHNFTPRVMRRYGIDYASICELRPDVIYVSITGFGTTGPWGERPLFGPGAEAVSGHNSLIGEPGAWPGRPGTIVYADNTCGMYALTAILAALEHRDATGEGTYIDLSLYETAVSQLGAAVSERTFGGATPQQTGNADANYAVHGVFEVHGQDRYVAIAAADEQVEALTAALGIAERSPETIAEGLRDREGSAVVAALQEAGIAAAEVADAADHVVDEHLWARGYFGLVASGDDIRPHAGPPFGDGASVAMAPPHGVGEDNRAILRDLAGLPDAQIDALEAAGVIGAHPLQPPRPPATADVYARRIERGELSRVDAEHEGWRRYVSE